MIRNFCDHLLIRISIEINQSSAGFNMILIIDNATVFGDYHWVQNQTIATGNCYISSEIFMAAI